MRANVYVIIFTTFLHKGEEAGVFPLTSLFHPGWLLKYGLLRRLASLHSSLLVRGRRTSCGTRNLEYTTSISPTQSSRGVYV